MSDPRWTRIEEAFGAALDTPPGERERILAGCGDEAMRAEVRRLLAIHEALPDGFLEGLDAGRAAELLDGGDPAAVGRYEIVRRIGRGATGVVYLARDRDLDRLVALKLLVPWLSGRPEAARRFADEARTASALDHPHIATIHEIGRADDGRLYITMAYYEGETLRARLARGPLPVAEALGIARELADALSAAHGQGIVHRDVKPENVALTARGCRLLDFGVATMAGDQPAGGPAGTLAYMSPEQVRGEPVSAAADLWALGVVLYEMLAGRRPFAETDPVRLGESIGRDAPAPLAGVPPRVARVVGRCLDPEPSRRYTSAEALLADLTAAAAPRAGSRTRFAAAAVGLAIVVAAGFALRGERGAARTEPPAASAADLALQGRQRMQRGGPEDLEQAAILLREAIARDSNHAPAYLDLAQVYMLVQAARPAERFERAKPLVRRALAADSNLAAAHRTAGWIAMWYDRDWAAAGRHLERAVALDPNDVWNLHWYAALLSATGRPEESLAITRRAAVLDPVGVRTTMHVGLHLIWTRRYEEAIAVLRQTLEADSSFGRARALLGRALLHLGRHEAGLAELRHGRIEYGAFEGRALLGYGLGLAGQAGEARAILAEYEARARVGYVSPINLVAIHLGLGQVDRALDWLERVPDDRGVMFFLLSDPLYDPLRPSPRYLRVLERLNLRGYVGT